MQGTFSILRRVLFNIKAVLKLNVDILHNVDPRYRHEDSCGSSGTGETLQALSAEEAHRPPRGLLSILERKSTTLLFSK
jgi:hypothetical protein